MGQRLLEQERLDGLMSDNGYPYPSKTELINIFVSSCVESIGITTEDGTILRFVQRLKGAPLMFARIMLLLSTTGGR